MLSLSPNSAVCLLTAGIGLIYIELNRPGIVLAGSVGLLCTLLAFSSLARIAVRPWAAGTLLACLLLLALNLRRETPILTLPCVTVALFAALLRLPSAGSREAVSWFVALPCAMFLGVGTTLLTTIARRARQNKGLDLSRARTSRPEPLPLDP